ncbi:hypothetical protein [Candidatus Regiella insecticola]|nr:hypothetical protein [Candidatus Regiella insecticola]
MAIVDITQFSEFREVFPELTPVQFETAMLFALRGCVLQRKNERKITGR